MTITWTSGYNIDEAVLFVEWGWKDQPHQRSPAGTLTFHRNSMCGPPARTVGWHYPGFIHTSFLKDLWPNMMHTYRLGHMLMVQLFGASSIHLNLLLFLDKSHCNAL
ncbi:putative inactive purple acid phosphatase 27 [Capsicum chinense]|uniref:Inactive purple acid phosphatase 27 n=1 Tax=Capsicum annuum TaxID=4072 RepID=A0A1U8H7A0_CAPAN|nr:hypothetical protein FXO37_34875 [Capsicum annuum]KAF3641308.1 hypothetical protein FXO38_21685 [Capsicum annuum]PHT75589.1 hypothetical protein T459_19111 [Capsicum annuum]PHU11396.1 putative inactive purple acid phosphatase 27 [Capsicum chinense]